MWGLITQGVSWLGKNIIGGNQTPQQPPPPPPPPNYIPVILGGFGLLFLVFVVSIFNNK